MTHKDLIVGKKYRYKDDNEDCQVTVIKIDNEAKEVTFKDWDDMEWSEPFIDIPEVIKREIN